MMKDITSKAGNQKVSIFIQFSTLDVCFLYYYKNDDQEVVLHWIDILKSLLIAETKESK